ncbi:MAG: TolC family protein [Pseudomonas sp.]
MNWNRVRWRLPLLLAPALLALALGHARAQQAPATLSLEEAITLARRYNPDYRMRLNDQGVADWQVAEAYARLLPTGGIGSQYSYELEGTPRLSQLTLSRQPPSFYSGYGINFRLGLSPQTFFGIKQARANRTATDAQVAAFGYTLTSDVTRDYLAAMRSRDAVVAARQDLETARDSKKLADARFAGGAVTQLDPAQGDVVQGRAEVALVQAENLYEADKLRLLQRLGLTLDRDVELTSQLTVFTPSWTRQDLLQQAMSGHPQLQAARSAESASVAASRSAKLAYLPSFAITAGWGGGTNEIGDRQFVLDAARGQMDNRRGNCEFNNDLASVMPRGVEGYPRDCSGFVYTDAIGAQALRDNDMFPFNFTSSPPSFTLSVNLPIFDGLTRERQMQQARAAADDARLQRRQAELAQQTIVATAHGNVVAAHRLVEIEQRNVKAAELQLNLARESYRLGGGQFLQLAQAQQAKAQADRAYLTALYSFHENVAALEAAVGRPLRQN